MPADRRHDCADRRTVNAGQGFQHETRNRHQRAGIAGRNAGIGFAFLDQIDRHAHRRILLVAQRQRRHFIHADDFTGMVDAHPGFVRFGKQYPNPVFKTDKNDLHIPLLTQEFQCGRHGDDGTMIPAHAIDGDGNCHPEKSKRKGRESPLRESACQFRKPYSFTPLATFLPR